MRLFRNSIFTVANIFGFLIGVAMFGSMIFIPVYLQVVDGMSPTESGLAMVPMVLGIFTTSIGAGRMMSKNGKYKRYPVAGALVVTAGLVMLSMLDNTSPYWFAGISMYVMGLGLGLTMQVLIVVVQNSVDRSDMGVATSSVTFFRQMGGSFGTALFGAILSSRLATHMADVLAGNPAAARAGGGKLDSVTNNVEAIKALPEPLHGLVTQAFSLSLHDTFIAAVPLTVVAVVVALFLKEIPLTGRQAPQAPAAGGASDDAESGVPASSGSSPTAV